MENYEEKLKAINPFLLESRLFKEYKKAKTKFSDAAPFTYEWLIAQGEVEKIECKMDIAISQIEFFNEEIKNSSFLQLKEFQELNALIDKLSSDKEELKEQIEEKEIKIVKTLFAISVFR